MSMTLQKYLSEQDLTYEAFGTLIGVTTSTAWRYANGKRFPGPAVMRRIIQATGGAVGPNDFLDQNSSSVAA